MRDRVCACVCACFPPTPTGCTLSATVRLSLSVAPALPLSRQPLDLAHDTHAHAHARFLGCWKAGSAAPTAPSRKRVLSPAHTLQREPGLVAPGGDAREHTVFVLVFPVILEVVQPLACCAAWARLPISAALAHSRKPVTSPKHTLQRKARLTAPWKVTVKRHLFCEHLGIYSGRHMWRP